MSDEIIHKTPHAYIVYEVYRCNEEMRDKTPIPNCKGNDCEVDPKCAEPQEIDEWLSHKRMAFQYIDNKVNLQHG